MKTGKGRNLTMLCADKSVYHAKTHTYTISPEYEEWETKDTKGPQYEFVKAAFTSSVDGLVCVKESDGDPADAHDTPDMIAMAMTGQVVDVVAKLAIEGTAEHTYGCKCVIDSFEVSETVGSKATYKASFKGYGLTNLDKA